MWSPSIARRDGNRRCASILPSLKPNPTPGAEARIFLGLDFGTSGARVIAIDANHAPLFKTQYRFVENSWHEWRSALFLLLGAIPADLRKAVHAIAFCGTSATSLICDDAGLPLLPAVRYDETRSPAASGMIAVGHLTSSPSSSLSKLLWFYEQLEAAHACYFLHQADWLAFLLHGKAGFSDYHNALKLGYDAERLEYPEWLLALPIGSLLPQVLPPGSVAGTIRQELAEEFGFPPNCLVRAGTTDSIAAFFASGANRPGQAVTSLGSTLVLKLLSKKRVESAEHGIYSHRCGDLWLAGGASNCGGAVLETLFGRDRLKALSAEIDPRQPCSFDYYPLNGIGERFPVNDFAMQPRLEPRPERDAEYLHGLLESLARIEQQGYQLLERLGATPVTEIFTAGGGASNPTWQAIRKRVLAQPVRPEAHIEAAMGAALLAAEGERLLYSSTGHLESRPLQ